MFLQNVIVFFNIVPITIIFLCETDPVQRILVNTEDADGLVLEHQVISNHRVEYAPTHLQLFMG